AGSSCSTPGSAGSSSGAGSSPPHAVNRASAAIPAKPVYSLERLESVFLNTGFSSFVLSVLSLYLVFNDGPRKVQLTLKSSCSWKNCTGCYFTGADCQGVLPIRHRREASDIVFICCLPP